MRAIIGSALALVVIPAASASHPSFVYDERMNLDRDPATERVRAFDDADHDQPLAMVRAYDVCRGKTIEHRLARGRDLRREELRGSRALGRRGILFSIAFGTYERIIRVVALRRPASGACPTQVALFDYSTAYPRFTPPRGFVLDDAHISVGDFSRAYAGRELRLRELYAERLGGPPLATRLSFFRYRAGLGLYKRYRTFVDLS